MQRLLRPGSVAVVGATPRLGAAATRVLNNLLGFGFPGRIFPVNPRYDEVLGLPCYPSLGALPERPDVAFIAVAAEGVLSVLEEAAACGVRSVVVNAAGFAESGPKGAERQAQLSALARRAGIALSGPNNMGFANIHDRVCLWTPRVRPPLDPGSLAFISQSGSISLALTEHQRRLGFAYVITTGNEAVCTAADYLEAVIRDERVTCVALFLEVIRDPVRFAAAATEAGALGKPIVVLKVGRTARASSVVQGHTGAVTDDAAICDAFFRHFGAMRVDDIDALIEAIVLLSYHPRPPRHGKVAVVTCSGGEAGLVADLGSQFGVTFADFAPATSEKLRAVMPQAAEVRNPLDIWSFGWNVDRFRTTLEALLSEPDAGVLACSTDAPFGGGVDVSVSCEMAALCVAMPARSDKQIVFYNNLAGPLNASVQAILRNSEIPYLSGMRTALAVIGRWTRLKPPAANREATIPALSDLPDPATLSDAEKVRLLAQAGIAMADCIPVASAGDAVAVARQLGYPVALKGTAPDLPHKTENGLVRLDLGDDAAVSETFTVLASILAARSAAGRQATVVVQPMVQAGIELLLGVRNDTAFGPVVIAGLGGALVEVSREVSLRMAPVDHETAREMLQETRVASLLAGVRGQPPFDLKAVQDAIVALSRFGVAARHRCAAIEINPFIVLAEGAFGVDVVIEPHPVASKRVLGAPS
ncbi:MAG: acetate--CoA ligase family protein [Acetobacteraceae bacterium]